MSDEFQQYPLLNKIYQKYLNDENSASFVRAVSARYSMGSLERLAKFGRRVSRRAAILAIGFLGDYQSNSVLGEALHDSDRAVRLLADHGIRQLWFRVDSDSVRRKLSSIYRLNQCRQFGEAIFNADEILNQDDSIAEAWNQRGIANYALENYYESRCDCWQALELNPFQFSAALGLGHCHMQLNEVSDALECFRIAIDINPDLENVRAQIDHLERMLEGK